MSKLYKYLTGAYDYPALYDHKERKKDLSTPRNLRAN